jgi:Leucine-rich repeat (LRR) protein
VEDLVELRHLDLRHTKVISLSPLKKSKKLIDLQIGNTNISDLSPLYELKDLYYLEFDNTPITKEATDELRKKLPYVKLVTRLK